MFDYRDTAVFHGEADQAFAATRDDAVNGVVLLEQNVECCAIGGGDDLNGVFVDPGFVERFLNDRRQLHVAVEGFLAAA